MDYVIRPATKDDFKALYPEALPLSVRAWAVDWKGKLACISGVILMPGAMTVFMKMKDGLSIPKSTIWKGSVEMMEVISEMKVPIFAVRDTCKTGSDRFLRRLGFSFVGTKEGMEVYQWRTQ